MRWHVIKDYGNVSTVGVAIVQPISVARNIKDNCHY